MCGSNPHHISDNPFISADKAQTVANYIFKKIGGMRFRPLDATLLSNPLIESGDVALVTDRKPLCCQLSS